MNNKMKLSEHLTTSSVAALGNSSKLDGARCSKSLSDNATDCMGTQNLFCQLVGLY